MNHYLEPPWPASLGPRPDYERELLRDHLMRWYRANKPTTEAAFVAEGKRWLTARRASINLGTVLARVFRPVPHA